MSLLPSLCTLALLAPLSCANAEDPPRPNFVVILADDLTYRDLGCYGGQARTPHIDGLAAEGMRFTACFQAASMCSPTRHCLYTGLYPVKSGAYPNHTFAKEGTKSIAHYLAPAGYRVALSGKAHVAPPSVFPFEYSSAPGPDFAAIERLFAESREARKPFCLFVCSNDPHDPWTGGDRQPYDAASLVLPPYLLDTPKTRDAYARYLAEVTEFDAQVGRTLELLARHGLAQETIVIVLSEHGSSMPFGKWTLYDTGIQSACIVRWPDEVRAGSVSAALVEYVDLVPTLLEAAGVPVPAGLDGQSFLPILRGATTQGKRHVFALQTTRGMHKGAEYFGIRSARSERYKLIVNLTPEATFANPSPASGVLKSWLESAEQGEPAAIDRVQRFMHRPAEELYDLHEDPFEWTNRAADPALAEVKAELRAALESWMAAQGDRGQETEMAALERTRDPKEGTEED